MLLALVLLLPIAASDAYCDARAFGAAGDGVSDDTAAITAALGACDHVVLRKGSYLSGTVRLRSHSVLEIRASAALLAIKAKRDRYAKPEADFYRKRKKTAWNQDRNRVIQRRFNVRVPRAIVPERGSALAPRDHRSSKNEPKRVETDRERSL